MSKIHPTWQVKSLGEVIESLESGGRPKGGGLSEGDFPSLGAEHLNNNGSFNYNSMKFIPTDFFDSMNRGIIRADDILIVKDGATTGKTSLIKKDFPFSKAAINEHLFIVRTNKEVLEPRFAFYYLYSPLGNLQIMNDFRGSAQGGISREFVNKVSIPLPPLSIQKQIAEILQQTDKARQKRKEANKLTDEFLQSTFIEMFGDPVKNPKGWEKNKIIDVILNIENENPLSSPTKVYDYIDISSIDNLKKTIVEIKKICGSNAPSRARQLLKCNDVIVSTVRPNLNAVALVKNNFSNPIASTGFCILRTNSNIVIPEYLFQITKQSFFIARLSKLAKGASYPAVTAGQITEIKIPTPHLLLQQQFAEIANKTEVLKEKQKQSAQELENLFRSLMQKAFKGELNFN